VEYHSLMEKRFAVTGATGLLGSNLVNRLLKMGYEVNVLIKDESAKSILSKNVTRTYGDISDKHDIEFFIQKSNPSHFIHLAAQTQAYDSLRYPYATFFNNMVGTLNILESLREYGNCSAIIVASSDKAYGELIGSKYQEQHPLNGIYPYDASKSATDLISNSYRQSYKLPIIVTRACNIYGIGDYNRQRLIPGIVNSYLKNSEFIIRNGGKDNREYLHVEDAVDAYVALLHYAETKNRFGAFNISSGDAYTTIDLFNLVQKKIKKPILHKIVSEPTLEIMNQFMDSQLLKEETNWIPKQKLSNTIGEIVQWYLENT
jgi:CDP-glucose 4,6-dehydratase